MLLIFSKTFYAPLMVCAAPSYPLSKQLRSQTADVYLQLPPHCLLTNKFLATALIATLQVSVSVCKYCSILY